MSERKVLQKYYPPEWDPRTITNRKGPKQTGPRIQTVRLAAPFSMRCTTCGEYIYTGRKFNARKITDRNEKYLGIQVFSFHIKCTRCSGEIIFRTDPKNNEYAMTKGAVRNLEPWRNMEEEEETVEQRLDRLEKEEAEEAGQEEKNAMEVLEAKNLDARREMEAADALDEIRHRNARINRSQRDGVDYADAVVRTEDEERERLEKEDEEAARRAFAAARGESSNSSGDGDKGGGTMDEADGPTMAKLEDDVQTAGHVPPQTDKEKMPPPPPPQQSFKRVVKKKKDHSAMLGIKKKPSLV